MNQKPAPLPAPARWPAEYTVPRRKIRHYPDHPIGDAR